MSDTRDRLAAALADRYRVEREIGRGGMATVYLAHDLRHDRPVALKMLNPELGAAIGAERFQREILIAANLSHPHILPVHDSGVADGLLFYVMPYVEGESLRARLDREHQLSLEDALDIAGDVAAALSFAHSRGVIHRDVKPENILLHSGQAVVADFGIARATASAAEDQRITHTGLAIGTPRYMSPEQAAGSTEIDGRADQYSLGCMVYEMLAGRPPHVALTPQAVLARKLSAERPAALHALRSSVTPALDAVVMRSLAATPADRYATAAEFIDALRAAAAGIPTEQRRRRPWAIRRRVTRRQALGAAAALALLVLGAVAGRTLLRPAPPPLNPLGLAVFPFRATGAGSGDWSEAVSDLLATAVDGTPDLTVADPWTLWRSLRPDAGAFAVAPDPAQAEPLAARAGAGRFVIGSVVQTGTELTLTARVYQVGDPVPGRTLTAVGPVGQLPALVQQLAVGIIAQVGGEARLPDARSLESAVTPSAEALKAYLDARGAMRRGLIDSAERHIDRALALDSNFALALVDATSIKSWAAFQRGAFFVGLMPLAERAVTFADSLGERPRLRATAMLASVRTEGAAAAEATRRILQRDSTDLDAWNTLAYFHTVYGWQYGASADDALAAADRVVRLDPTYVPGLVRRALLGTMLEAPGTLARHAERLRAADTTTVLVRGALDALAALDAGPRAFDTLRTRLAARPTEEWIPVHRALRIQDPVRAEALLTAVEAAAGPGTVANRARVEQVRLLIAEGRLARLDSLLQAGSYADAPWLASQAQRWIIAADLAGVGDSALTRRAVQALSAALPIDSARAWFETYPVWWTGWLLAAWHATSGDPRVTRRWAATLETLPRGGTPRDYLGALTSDLDARLAARRGDAAAARTAAHRAFDLWGIHTENDWEAFPDPGMRLHLGALLRATGAPDSAAAILRSLVPPTSWFGFLTARAALELGELAEQRAAYREAAEHYRLALRLWTRGDEDVVGDWRARARAGLERALRRTG